MRREPASGITLLELLIAISLLSLIVIGFSGLELFGRYQVVGSDKRTRVQNEAAHVVEHMAKNLANAVGNRNNFPVTVLTDGLRVRIDSNLNGAADAGDLEIAYQLVPENKNIMRYYSNYSSVSEDISRKISAANWTWAVTNNWIGVEVTACDDPDGTPVACGTTDNPAATVITRIRMPAVSIN